ncbi:glycosyltransferase family 4 protein [Deinococcus sp. YIM 134068]|uniref:glycosyltransferase family 4 protein n=1 Tax=Deinococcus lichenicola TaxID=3118910 RepID=UPI002F91E471
MNVLVVHNFYRQPGGEDEVFRAETRELARQGVNVHTFTVHNDDLRGHSAAGTARATIWNPAPARALSALVREHGIDVVHFHNTFQVVSPAAYRAVRGAGAAVVQTLHNYRLLCAAATLYRDGHPCGDCLGKTPPWPAVRHACYRGSRAASGVVAAMQTTHRLLGTYDRAVDLYITLTDQMRDVYVRGGLPGNKLVVKSNFLAEDPGVGGGDGSYALFAGRLTPEKGVRTLLTAWRESGLGERLPLRVVGDGPLAGEVEAAARSGSGVEFLGQRPHADVLELMRGARLLVFPSEWPEPFGLTLIEALATGLPVVAGHIGSAATLVEHGHTGRHFRPGDPADLAAQVRWLLDHPEDFAPMRGHARRAYEANYTAPANVRALLDLYRRAIRQRAGQPHPGHPSPLRGGS